MNLPIPKFGRRSAVLLSTSLVIIGAFAYYFLVYVKSHESRFISRSYRALERKALNVENKHTAYSGYLKFVSSSIKNSVKELIGDAGTLSSSIRDLENQIDDLYEEAFDLEDSYDSKRKSGQKIDYGRVDQIYDKIDQLYKEYDNLSESQEVDQLRQKIEEKVNEITGNVDLNSFYYAPADYRYIGDSFNEFNWTIKEDDKSYFSFSESPKTFIKPVLDASSGELFDNYLLLRENNEVMDAERIEDKYSIIFQTFSNRIDLQSISPFVQGRNHSFEIKDQIKYDSMYQRLGPKIVKPTDVELFNTKYKLLFHRFSVKDEAFGRDQTYYLGGFVKSSTFRKESQKVEVFLIVLAILTLLVLIISMPILKLGFMSSIERLHISNVLSAAGSIILGVPVLLLIIFCIYDFVVIGNKERNEQLQDLSEKIEASFTQEVGVILRQLTHFDDQVANENIPLDSLDISNYKEFNQLFWINEDGFADRQRNVIQVDTSARISLKSRDYFRKVVNDEMWTFKDDSVEYDFYLQSIVSWTDITNEAAISIPSKLRFKQKSERHLVAAMTSQLHSVMDPILPMGFGFAIIDDEGEVYFHSNRDRILQENLLVESNKPSDLRSSIYSRVATDALIKYRNTNHKAFIQPINSLPLHLVTFYNNDVRNAEIQGVVSISIFLLFGTFAAVLLMVLALQLIQKRRSKLKIRTFLFYWLKPDVNRSYEYQFLTILFLLIGGFLLLMILWEGVYEQDLLFTFIITNAYLFLISYTWLTSNDKVKYQEKKSYKRSFNVAFILFIVGADIVYFDAFSGSAWWIIFQICLTLITIFCKDISLFVGRLWEKIPDNKLIHVVVEKHAYNSFLFSWLLISSILPIFYIFMVSHNQENMIWEKLNQLEIAKQYQEKVRILDDRVAQIKPDLNLRENFFNSKLDSGQYLLDSRLSVNKDDAFTFCAKSSTDADYILSKARPHYSDLIIRSKGFVYDISDEKNRRWCFPTERIDTAIQLQFKDNRGPIKRTAFDTIYVTSSVEKLSASSGHSPGKSGHNYGSVYRGGFIVIVILVFIGVYCLIDYCINKIYGREYSAFRNTLPLTVENFKEISIGADDITHKQRQIVLLGLPKSNKSNLLKVVEGKLLNIDMIYLNHKDKWDEILTEDFTKYDGVIIENFEYGISSHSANVVRLSLMEQLVYSNLQKLLISSNVHPSIIVDFYQTKLRFFQGDDKNLKDEYEHALETWRHILGGFIIVHNPIKENRKINSFLKSSWIKNETLKELFIGELNRGSFLPNLLPALKDYYVKLKKNFEGDENKISKEDLILRIQMLAESYYHGLWNSLSKEEKYIIYDLAKDRFVNINNRNGIRSLLEKGLLVYDNELRIMNMSFTNFVLSIIKKEEALKMEKEVREKGTWSSISAVIGLAVLGIIVFLFLGNPDFFQDFSALVGAIAAIVGILPRLTGLLNFSQSRAPANGVN